jgi:hypothetical protein
MEWRKTMRIVLLAATAALFALSQAHADDQDKKNLGAAAGGATGAIAGGVVGGPVGAVVGGVAGAILGSETAVPSSARTYVVEHPTDPVAIEGQLSTDYVFPDTVELHPIPDHPDLAYVYVENRPVIVRAKSRQVVYAPAIDAQSTGSTTIKKSKTGN